MRMLSLSKMPRPYDIRRDAEAAMSEAGVDMANDDSYYVSFAILRRHSRTDWPECFDTLRLTCPEYFLR
jgi:hypothetical protein